MSDAVEPVVKLRGLKRSFTQGDTVIEVLRGADLDIMPGEIVALLGPSGTGKSTMLQAVGLLEGGFQGSIRIAGKEAATMPSDERTALRREHLGFVYQFHHLLPEFNARDNVAMPLMVGGMARRKAREKADALLAEMGLSERLKHQPGQMSGGEQQRVAIARALVNDPRLVIADEPTGNLDPATTERVFESLIRMARSEGAAVLVATHNMALTQHMDRVLTLQDGKLTDFVPAN